MALIVPRLELPPAIPFTLQLTAVSVVFVTIAVNGSVFPSRTVPVSGETLTMIAGGGGGPTVPLPTLQPAVANAPNARSPANVGRGLPKISPVLLGKGSMPCAKQAKGQRSSGYLAF